MMQKVFALRVATLSEIMKTSSLEFASLYHFQNFLFMNRSLQTLLRPLPRPEKPKQLPRPEKPISQEDLGLLHR